ncbi:MAG: hypothetical protein K2L10_04725 [Ruminococcus sp.]|nr:hypothetical protein [Ruminococcus sp.]
MRTAKIISCIALVIQIFTAIFTESVSMAIKDIFDFSQYGDGFFPLIILNSILFLCIPFVYLFVFLGMKKNSPLFYFLSATVLLPSTLVISTLDYAYFLFFAVPCVLLAVSAVVVYIDGNRKGNREGLQKTKLMRMSKITALVAIIIPVIFQIANIDFQYEYLLATGVIESREGHAGAGSILNLVWAVLPFVYLFTISALFRVKKCNTGLYLASAILLFPFALLFFMDEITFIYIIPCVLLTVSAVIANIDKKNQKVKNLIRS